MGIPLVTLTILSFSCILLFSVYELLQLGLLPLSGHNSQESFPQAPEFSASELLRRIPEAYRPDDRLKRCIKIFSSSYIISAASQKTTHCGEGFQSHLDCFHAPREPTPHDWPVDTFCLARGVAVSRDEAETRLKLALQCPLDTSHPGNNVHSPYDYFFHTGVTHQLAEWNTSSTQQDRSCTAANGQPQWIVLVRRGLTSNLWDSFMEIWQAMHSVDILRVALDETGNPYMTEEDISSARIVFEDDEDLPFTEWWQLVLGNHAPPLKSRSLKPGCYSHVLLPLPGSSSPLYTAVFDPDFHQPCRQPSLVNAMRRRMIEYYGLERTIISAPDAPSITIIDRKQTRAIWGIEGLVQTVRSRFPSSNVTLVDFAELPLREQVQLAMNTDVLVGVHGAGLTHSLWLEPTSAVVEIKPPLFPGGLGYVAQLNGGTYFEGRGLWPEVWNKTINNVPLPPGWQRPETDTTWQAEKYMYVDPAEFLGLVEAAVRSMGHKAWKPALKAVCISNYCKYVPVDP